VNGIFRGLPKNPVWEGEEAGRTAAEEWMKDFPDHRAAKALPGYVRILVGPREEDMRVGARPEMMAWTAAQVEALLETAQGRSIAILVRTNRAVAYLMAELRARGIDASEEGATSLVDSPAVSTILALLRLADHPGDTLSAYQIAHSPLGEELGFPDFRDRSALNKVAADIRRILVSEGYGRTLTQWAKNLGRAQALGGRDLRRLLQLVEAGYRWDPQATLRPTDFVRYAQAERLAAPSEASLRVMTVHQAKGLEFDLVVLPELDARLVRGTGRYHNLLPLRDPGTGRIQRVFPRVPKAVRPLFPEIEAAAEQDRVGEYRDALGVLYVGVTRARHAVHLFVAEDHGDPPPSPAKTFSGLIRGSLDLVGSPFSAGDVVYAHGDPLWYQREGERKDADAEHAIPPSIPVVEMRAVGGRRRLLPQDTPTSWRRAERVDLGQLLRLGSERTREVGKLVHAWLELVRWVEDGIPPEEEARSIATREAPEWTSEEVGELWAELKGWIGANEVRQALSRRSYPPGAVVENEMPFAVRVGETILQGRMDRVVRVESAGRTVSALILDYKTDSVEPHDPQSLPRLVNEYRRQMEAYRRGAAALYGLEASSVDARIVFLRVGRVVPLNQGSDEEHGPEVP
jgi:ATP-dependent exoDNAse (exonuclease V) beta subunit